MLNHFRSGRASLSAYHLNVVFFTIYPPSLTCKHPIPCLLILIINSKIVLKKPSTRFMMVGIRIAPRLRVHTTCPFVNFKDDGMGPIRKAPARPKMIVGAANYLIRSEHRKVGISGSIDFLNEIHSTTSANKSPWRRIEKTVTVSQICGIISIS